MRAAAVLAFALAVAGCGDKACRDQTIFLNINVDGPASGADTLDIAIVVNGGAPKTVTVGVAGVSTGSLEIDFPNGYPSGGTVVLAATALAGGMSLASQVVSVVLSDSCESTTLDFVNATVGDGGDASMPDACVPSTMCPSTEACGKVSDGCGGTLDCGPCFLDAVYQPVANSGETIELDGLFGSTATVNFPGGATAPATVMSSSRISAVVPPSAGSGLISVTTNRVTTGGLAFTHATYVIAPSSLRTMYEQADYARQTPTIKTGGWGGGLVVTDTRVWHIGGGNASGGALGGVEEALIDADGSLRDFTSLGSLVHARALVTATRVGNFVYVIGGRNSMASAEPTIERAPINPDGSLGAFAVVNGLSLVKPRYAHSTAVVGKWLYVFGGSGGNYCNNGLVALASVERAPINVDGSLGAFADAGVSMTVARTSFATVIHNNTFYVVGGNGVAAIDMAPIGADGTLMPFQSATGVLPTAQTGVTAAVLGGQLYIFAASSGVLVANFNADGTVHNPTATASTLSNFTTYASLALVDDYVYLIGAGNGDCICSACFTATPVALQRGLLSSGALGPFSPSTMTLAAQRSDFAVAAVGNKVYLIGGDPIGAPDVQSATVQADGTLGPFTAVAGAALKTSRSFAAAAVVGNSLYIVGGMDASSTALGSVEVAPINPDGTLGAFDYFKVGGAQSNLVSPTGQPGALVLGNGLCAFGVNPFECAAVGANDALAAFASTAFNGGTRILAALGANAYSFVSSSAPIDSTGKITATFTAGSTNQTLAGASSIVLGGSLYLMGGFTGLDFSSAINIYPLNPSTSAPGTATGASLASKTTGQRNVLVHGQVYVFGGSAMGGPPGQEAAPLK
jgi:hypothetical protein